MFKRTPNPQTASTAQQGPGARTSATAIDRAGTAGRRFSLSGAPPIANGPVFRSVLCGVDGSPAGMEAVRQAAVLAGPSATLTLLAVTPLAGHPPFLPLPDAARAALADARRAVWAAGRDASVSTLAAATPAAGLLSASSAHDLIVVGGTEFKTALGVSLGPVASAAVGRAPQSVLVARPSPDAAVVGSILVAVDGSTPAHRATSYAAEIARRHGSDIALVAEPERDVRHVRELAEDAAAVAVATGVDPVILDEDGPAPRAIVAAAARIGASLIVLGSRVPDARRHSVSEQVARTAACSVLIVREPPPGQTHDTVLRERRRPRFSSP